MVLLADRGRKADWNCRLDDHDGIRVVLNDQLDDSLNRRGVKEILLAVVVGRSRNDNEVSIFVGGFCTQRCGEIQVLLCEVLLDVLVLNRRLTVVDEVNFFRDDVHCHDLMVLTQQRGNGQTDIAGSGNCNFHIIFLHKHHSVFN